MDSRPAAAESNQTYQQVASWGRISGPSTPQTPAASTSTSSSFTENPSANPYPPPTYDPLPLLVFQRQAQLLQYNKLISPGRGGGGVQTPPLSSVLPVPSIQATPPPPRSSSKVSNKDSRATKQSPATQSCHGTRGPKNTDRSDREGMTRGKDKDTSNHKMPPKQHPDLAHPLPSRPAQRATHAQQSTASSAQSNSVPSTPHQRARNLSFESQSREPSPTVAQNHSPRSAYSEPNGGVASLPPRSFPTRPCPYETAPRHFWRRIPYNIGAERLERCHPDRIKSRLSEDEERKLSTDMRELYDRLLPSAEVEHNRIKLVQKLEVIFNEEWPGHDIRVNLFGSSGNLLWSDDSDVDICITTDWKEMEGVCIIADLLKKRGMEKVVCVSTAKVPIVKIWDPELKLACDMNVNNTLALENTRMVRTYMEIDERVRPLAMVVKYWTRRRVINDAAFSGTLSSYTWICLIIAFLQLRNPPVLPALHQCPTKKLPTVNGHKTDFADDLSQLRGFGDKNDNTLGELLFGFFRFYAHEFDYDEMALSVRLGKILPKKEKNWHIGTGNQNLCVEEPFNRERNLGNTADDTSFRGIHLELRRAFDLVSEAKLEECCEQYVKPKEVPADPKLFTKPAPRPAIIRSSSQQHSGRGGRNGGGRGNRNHFRNGNSSRRASSSNAYENAQPPSNTFVQPAVLPNSMVNPGDLQWGQFAQHYPYSENMTMLSNALQMQDRLNWYTQYHYSAAHQQAAAHAQRLQASSAQPGERSRTNSFDQPPLTAPPRADYVWPFHVQQTFYHHHAGFGTYPSSPSAPNAASEFRRSLHRSSAATEAGSSSGGGTLRSQSQPASRTSAPTSQQAQGYGPSAQAVNGVPVYIPRQANLAAFTGLGSDDRTDSEADEVSSRAVPDSPPEEDSAGYLGYFVADSSTPPRKPTQGIPTLGDLSLNRGARRRLSTEGPQSVLDRRLQRTSRSPSPLGHGRTFSVGTNSAPLASGPFPQSNNRTVRENTPLVVNGSSFVAPSTMPSGWFNLTDDGGFDNPLHISQGQEANGVAMAPEPVPSRPQVAAETSPPAPERPLVVNGSTQSPALPPSTAGMQSFGQRMAAGHGPNGVTYATTFGGDRMQIQSRSSDLNRQRLAGRNQQAGIAPLDLAVANPPLPDSQHLSPVYEMRTPSPTVLRRFEAPVNHDKAVSGQSANSSEEYRKEQRPKNLQKPYEKNGVGREGDGGSPAKSRQNGTTLQESAPARAAKSEPDNASAWQKTKSKKKQTDTKTAANKAASQSEQPPKHESERKGG
ncbi:Poly(A) RNA polymerase cid13 [Cytospora mali]|uniref:polynucleotide adenylyltransferase n=1 Tax=Cytospora mali TaxID=578113 RepID=A0A194VAE3_CYTMA|nr:Poly(A) RNA polymerase cid13 [Valsa mali var. pyri (nom. inval.)]